MKKFLPSSFRRTIIIFLVWRVVIEIVLRLIIQLTSLDPQFPYYNHDLQPFYSRVVATWAHFDGVHYLRMAQSGYIDQGYPAFFPLYPLLVRFFTQFTHNPLLAGLIISNLSIFFAIHLLGKLYSDKQYRLVLPLIAFFPTSFYFFALYTESFFFLLIIAFFLLLKQEKWLPAALIAAIASSTRIIGASLSLALLTALMQANWGKLRSSGPRITTLFLLSLSGLIAYMTYLYVQYRDPLAFLHLQPLFGAERSGDTLILLPQVIYRYGKILLAVDPALLLYKRVILELSISLFFFYLLIKAFKRIPLPQLVYSAVALTLPTLTGTFSSMPRYVLVIFPLFFVWSQLIPRKFYLPTIIALAVLQIFFFTVFSSGHFVA